MGPQQEGFSLESNELSLGNQGLFYNHPIRSEHGQLPSNS